ncbi:hypothetical protein [Spirosoma aerophilum]
MMLSTLTAIAAEFGLTFIYGDKPAFNIGVDYTNPDLIVMYHEGFVSGSSTEDQQGAWETNYNMRIWLLFKSNLSDNPTDRKPRFAALEPLMKQILTRLSNNYEIKGPVPFSEGINQTDKNLDGIRFVVNCVSKFTQAYC